MSVRVLTALTGILLLLAGEAPLVAWAGAAAMDCCKDGHACCRRLHHRSQQSGRNWQGDFCGMPGCGGGAFGTVSIPLHKAAETAAPLQPSPTFGPVFLLVTLIAAAVQFQPEFFQRPPPAVF